MQRAVATVPGSGVVETIEIKPRGAPGAGQARLRLERVGICGTDRRVGSGHSGEPPPGHRWLVMGHEALGRVEALGGGDVSGLEIGDLVMPLVRRGCAECAPCQAGEADVCRSGRYQERGIRGLDGFLTSHALVDAAELVRAPAELGLTAVLAEPLSIAEKCVDVLRQVQRRVEHPCSHLEHGWDRADWGGCKVALVAGLGPIGLLAALKLRLEGVHTWLAGIHDEREPRVNWAREIGAQYLDLRVTDWPALRERLPDLDLALEMTGDSDLAPRLAETLGPNGCLVLVGTGGGAEQSHFAARPLVSRMVRWNQAMVGVINASRVHVEEAMTDLLRARARWGDLVDRLITHHFTLDDYQTALAPPTPDVIKAVVDL